MPYTRHTSDIAAGLIIDYPPTAASGKEKTMLVRNGSELIVGRRVMIYQDPMTEEDQEDIAKVTKINKICGCLAYCNVRFKREETVCSRAIRVY